MPLSGGLYPDLGKPRKTKFCSFLFPHFYSQPFFRALFSFFPDFFQELS